MLSLLFPMLWNAADNDVGVGPACSASMPDSCNGAALVGGPDTTDTDVLGKMSPDKLEAKMSQLGAVRLACIPEPQQPHLVPRRRTAAAACARRVRGPRAALHVLSPSCRFAANGWVVARVLLLRLLLLLLLLLRAVLCELARRPRPRCRRAGPHARARDAHTPPRANAGARTRAVPDAGFYSRMRVRVHNTSVMHSAHHQGMGLGIGYGKDGGRGFHKGNGWDSHGSVTCHRWVFFF